MVSPAITSPQKVPPLSYADRAKKAQNIKSPISSLPPRNPAHSVPITSSNSAPYNDSLTSSSSAQSDAGVDLATLSDVPSSSASARASNDLAAKALSVVAAHTSSQKSPVVNVWNIRMEQLAAARAALTKALAKETPPDSQDMPPSPQTPFKSPSAPTPNTSHGPSATVNGVASTSDEAEHDPFIVRTNANTNRASKPLPPPVDDTDSWPQVGKAAASTANTTAIHLGDSMTRNGPENDQVARVSRKSEKTKWVPIPSKELQATADALAKPSKRQSRKGQQHTNYSQVGPRSGTHTADGSTSGSAQSQSRGHSVSHSASHSRVQSRSESIQSSPHVPRERYLPADDAYGQGLVNHKTNNRSSRPSSPPLVVRLHLQPARSGVDLNISSSNGTYPAPSYDQVGVQTSDDSASSHPQHPTPQSQQYYYHPTAHVPMYPQPSGYPRQSATPPLLPVHYTSPGISYPIYAPYAVYDYHNSASHYGYWNANQSHPGSGTHSPAYPTPQAGLLYYFTHHALTYTQQQKPQQYPPLRGVLPGPSPREQFQAVAGYKEVAVGKELPVVFGSIGMPGASQSSSPAPLPTRKLNRMQGGDREEAGEDERAFTMFSIGVAPSESRSRLRARTSSKARSRTTTASTSELEVKAEGEVESSTPASTESKFIDLTDSQELRWEFGTTTSSLREDASVRSPSASPENLQVDMGTLHSSLHHPLPPVLPSITGFGVHSGMVYRSTSGSPSGEVLTGALKAVSISPHAEGALSSARSRNVASGDDFEVKDFGYGFGPASGTGRAPVITREEREAREQENRRERVKESIEKEREREERDRIEHELQIIEVKDHEYERDREQEILDMPVRLRRGSYNGGVGYDRGERGGRRGRGMNGFGRGYYSRRGGGFQQHIPQQQQHQQQPFTLTPPQAVFQPLQTVGEPPNGYYAQHQPPYITPGYEAHPPPTTAPTVPHTSPPVPVPVTTISFPLDPTRWYLLGQLEYYLSPQNMVQDFFLRQQMDARGWVPVSLIASFNRVRQLTMDMHLVRDVLLLSSMVQVKGDWVRMNGWERYVLPDAAASDVEKMDYGSPETYAQSFQEEEKSGYVQTYGDDFHAHGEAHTYGESPSHGEVYNDLSVVEGEPGGDANGDAEEDIDDDCEEEEEEEEEDDEEDVVFVMNHDDDGQLWPPERSISS